MYNDKELQKELDELGAVLIRERRHLVYRIDGYPWNVVLSKSPGDKIRFRTQIRSKLKKVKKYLDKKKQPGGSQS